MEHAYIRIDHLTKTYARGEVKALRDLSFAIGRGEFLVVIGLSGSGKSTLLRCINRLIDPSSGSIVIGGQDVTALSSSQIRRMRRRIGMIFQQFNLVDRATTLRNVLVGRLGYVSSWRALTGVFPRSDKHLAMACLERVGLEEKAYTRVDQLSGGQRQRVGIARALMQSPEILLADEPVSALDPATSHSIMQYLEQMNQEDGVTVLASLHFLSLARRFGTRIVALKDGILVFDGAPQSIDNARFKEIYGEDAEEVEVR